MHVPQVVAMTTLSSTDHPVSLPFRDRSDAARHLVVALAKHRGKKPVILAIPRGAVPMGRIIADALGGELDVVLVRKLGAPGNPEFAIGAVDERGTIMLNEESAAWAGADDDYVQREAARQLALIRERRANYRPGQPPIMLTGRTVIVVDDGLATGSTMIAALKAARAQRPDRLVCAVPVAAEDSLAQVAPFADEVVCLATPWPFSAVGLHYRDFSGISDAQAIKTLATATSDTGDTVGSARNVRIPTSRTVLDGDLMVPPSPCGLVVFAHGSGSSRRSSRNRFVADALNRHRFATLLFDLLTESEDRDSANRFDIGLLAGRLDAAVEWARSAHSCRHLPIGLFGASTGAAAALTVAVHRPTDIAAVVSRGGRPDLAGASVLSRVRTPTLLIVGSDDTEVLQLNRAAQSLMGEHAQSAIVQGATHLFEEPGALQQVATIAAEWFERFLRADAG
jgi:putative phosphoribosyl transferase